MIRIILILWMLIFAASSFAGDISKCGFLWAIRQVESGDNYHKLGRLGERGAYQFRRGTWRQHTSACFGAAYTHTADVVAIRHFDYLVERLSDSGDAVDMKMVAMAWNAGLSRVKRGSVPAVSRDYAARVVALALAYKGEPSSGDGYSFRPPMQPIVISMEPEVVASASPLIIVPEPSPVLLLAIDVGIQCVDGEVPSRRAPLGGDPLAVIGM